MSTRRGFFALIGNAAITGFVAQHASAATPTLLLPPKLIVDQPPAGTLDEPTGLSGNRPLLNAALSSGRSQMHVLVDIKRAVPQEAFLDWLESGLRKAKFYDGRDEAAMERRVGAAVEKHGSIIAAMRAGAL